MCLFFSYLVRLSVWSCHVITISFSEYISWVEKSQITYQSISSVLFLLFTWKELELSFSVSLNRRTDFLEPDPTNVVLYLPLLIHQHIVMMSPANDTISCYWLIQRNLLLIISIWFLNLRNLLQIQRNLLIISIWFADLFDEKGISYRYRETYCRSANDHFYFSAEGISYRTDTEK